ncbi:MAG: hypothetical protein ACYSR4_03190 [Planctomycetota bacterium]
MGIVCPLGHDIETVWQAMLQLRLHKIHKEPAAAQTQQPRLRLRRRCHRPGLPPGRN